MLQSNNNNGYIFICSNTLCKSELNDDINEGDNGLSNTIFIDGTNYAFIIKCNISVYQSSEGKSDVNVTCREPTRYYI